MQLVSKNCSGLSYQVLSRGQELLEGGNATFADLPTVFLLHGYGANGQDLIPLVTHSGFAEKVRCRWVFLQAPISVPLSPFENGWAWFPLNMELLFSWSQSKDVAALAQWNPLQLSEVARRVVEVLKKETQQSKKVVLGGFSQGAIVSLETAFVAPTDVKLDALVLLSGTWICEETWKKGLREVKLPPVFQSHGRHDPILPFAAAVRLHEELKTHATGVSIEFHPFGGGHEIPIDVLQRLHRFLESVVAV